MENLTEVKQTKLKKMSSERITKTSELYNRKRHLTQPDLNYQLNYFYTTISPLFSQSINLLTQLSPVPRIGHRSRLARRVTRLKHHRARTPSCLENITCAP